MYVHGSLTCSRGRRTASCCYTCTVCAGGAVQWRYPGRQKLATRGRGWAQTSLNTRRRRQLSASHRISQCTSCKRVSSLTYFVKSNFYWNFCRVSSSAKLFCHEVLALTEKDSRSLCYVGSIWCLLHRSNDSALHKDCNSLSSLRAVCGPHNWLTDWRCHRICDSVCRSFKRSCEFSRATSTRYGTWQMRYCSRVIRTPCALSSIISPLRRLVGNRSVSPAATYTSNTIEVKLAVPEWGVQLPVGCFLNFMDFNVITQLVYYCAFRQVKSNSICLASEIFACDTQTCTTSSLRRLSARYWRRPSSRLRLSASVGCRQSRRISRTSATLQPGESFIDVLAGFVLRKQLYSGRSAPRDDDNAQTDGRTDNSYRCFSWPPICRTNYILLQRWRRWLSAGCEQGESTCDEATRLAACSEAERGTRRRADGLAQRLSYTAHCKRQGQHPRRPHCRRCTSQGTHCTNAT